MRPEPLKSAQTIDICAAPDRVFHWLSDPDRAMAWMRNVKSYRIIDEVEGVKGTTFLERVEEDGEGLELRGIVTGFEKNAIFAVHLESEVNTVDVVFRLASRGETTRVTQDIEMSFKIPGMNANGEAMAAIRGRVSEQMKTDLGRLKAVCEQGF
ncbi:MAG: SRPBCC family protein [Planctomycetota bacterium]|jgi:uncharacterized membrane protein